MRRLARSLPSHVDAGALYVDEYSQLQGELNHAGALRTTYAREAKHGLNKDVYFKPQERWGRLPVVVYSGDHLQLPPVPASSSMLASLEGTTNEHKVGAKIFRDKPPPSHLGLPTLHLGLLFHKYGPGVPVYFS